MHTELRHPAGLPTVTSLLSIHLWCGLKLASQKCPIIGAEAAPTEKEARLKGTPVTVNAS